MGKEISELDRIRDQIAEHYREREMLRKIKGQIESLLGGHEILLARLTSERDAILAELPAQPAKSCK